MEDKPNSNNHPEGPTPEQIIAAFCRQYPEHAVFNRVWLWYSLALQTGQITEAEQNEFALFKDQLNNLMAAVYNYHQANKASSADEGGTQ